MKNKHCNVHRVNTSEGTMIPIGIGIASSHWVYQRNGNGNGNEHHVHGQRQRLRQHKAPISRDWTKNTAGAEHFGTSLFRHYGISGQNVGFGQSVGVATVGVAKRPYVTFLRLIARSPVAVGVADRMYVKFRRSIVSSLMGRHWNAEIRTQ